MNKSNLLFKDIKSISSSLTKSKTSKAEPCVYNSNYSKNWEVDNGLVNKLSYIINNRRWDNGYPASLESA